MAPKKEKILKKKNKANTKRGGIAVLKFGGTSVGTPERIRSTIDIVLNAQKKYGRVAVVVSAMSGVTDKLLEIGKLASLGNQSYKEILKEVEKKHIDAVKALLHVKNQAAVLANVKVVIIELEDILKGIFLLKELYPKISDRIASFGERLSAYIISEAMKDRGVVAECLDARNVVSTDDNFINAKVDRKKTYKNIQHYFKNHHALQIITGFIGSNEKNETTTLGRGGSDYSASLFGAALHSPAIEIWTDVSGVLTADPRKVKNAFTIPDMTYEEAMEMSYFGAKVIYPPTMQPALEKNIPLYIKNTCAPHDAGTLIWKDATPSQFIIKGISSVGDISLLQVSGTAIVGAAGFSKRLFGAVGSKKINIILITQSSSEHSICLAVDSKSAAAAKHSIEEEFKQEISSGTLKKVEIEDNLSVLAVVGENMKRIPGVSGKLFQALGRSGVNVIAVAQGSSELNISIVIKKEDEAKALNCIHRAFFSGSEKAVNIFLAGPGLIGGTLIKQIEKQKEMIKRQKGIDIRIIAIADSKKIIIDEKGINLSSWKEKLASSEQINAPTKMLALMKDLNLPRSIFVDCTSSEKVGDLYEEILKSGISIATPNKKANSGKLSYYRALRRATLESGAQFFYETNVGAGLPIISTLRDLVSTGDEVIKIEAVLSGTLSYIFNNFIGKKKWSDIVLEAKAKGYTEPDPRDDLNGMDFARKLLILSREIGLPLELKDINVEGLLNEECMKAKTVGDFLIKLPKMDALFEKKKNTAAKDKKVLRFIGVIEKGKASVSLKEVSVDHPFYNLSGSDNIISFTTKRYAKETPLVIKGPGAGAEVTAAGIFADIIKIAELKYE